MTANRPRTKPPATEATVAGRKALMPEASCLAAMHDEPLTLSVWLPGTPIPKGRPRFTTRGGRPRAYTPARTRNAEDAWVLAARAALRGAELPFGHDPVAVEIWFSFLASARTATCIPPGDLDNLAKIVLDALTRARWWGDDRQVVQLRCVKAWGFGSPGASVIVSRHVIAEIERVLAR